MAKWKAREAGQANGVLHKSGETFSANDKADYSSFADKVQEGQTQEKEDAEATAKTRTTKKK